MTMKGAWFGPPSRASPHIDCWVVKRLEQTVLVWTAKRLLLVQMCVRQRHFISFSARRTKCHVATPTITTLSLLCSLSLVGRVIFFFTCRWTTIHRRIVLSLTQMSLNVFDGVWFEITVSSQISISPAWHSFFSISLELRVKVPWRDMLQQTLFSSHLLSIPHTYPALGLDSCHASPFCHLEY